MKFLHILFLAAILGLTAIGASAEEAKTMTAAAVQKDKAALAGKLVSVQGKVVKVNNRIMGRNFIHVQDGTGKPLIFTSNDTAEEGNEVKATGRVVLDRDFGSGYMYPLLVEEAKITKIK